MVTASGQIAGYTLCNDMSSRSIEGENPLYLPQAKTYAGACALGPGIVLAADVADPGGLVIELEIRRAGAGSFAGRTDTGQMSGRWPTWSTGSTPSSTSRPGPCSPPAPASCPTSVSPWPTATR